MLCVVCDQVNAMGGNLAPSMERRACIKWRDDALNARRRRVLVA